MAFAEDLDAFVEDFGVDVSSGIHTGKAILNTPGMVAAGGEVLTTDYTLRYVTATFPGLVYGTAITVDGVAYTVNHTLPVGDGKFSESTLSKT